MAYYINLCILSEPFISEMKLIYLLNPFEQWYNLEFPCRFLIWMTGLKMRTGNRISHCVVLTPKCLFNACSSLKSWATVFAAYLFIVVVTAVQLFSLLQCVDLLFVCPNLISSYQLSKYCTTLCVVSICLVGWLSSFDSQSVGILQRDASWKR